MRIPPHHYALVGSLWNELEQALHEAGTTGATADLKIRSLRHRMGPHAVRRLHYVRLQRNRLMHFPTRPLEDPAEWERACRESIARVRALRSSDVPRQMRSHAAHHRPRTPRPPASSGTSVPFWMKALGGGLMAWVVLQDARLTELAGLALIAWAVLSVVRKG